MILSIRQPNSVPDRWTQKKNCETHRRLSWVFCFRKTFHEFTINCGVMLGELFGLDWNKFYKNRLYICHRWVRRKINKKSPAKSVFIYTENAWSNNWSSRFEYWIFWSTEVIALASHKKKLWARIHKHYYRPFRSRKRKFLFQSFLVTVFSEFKELNIAHFILTHFEWTQQNVTVLANLAQTWLFCVG